MKFSTQTVNEITKLLAEEFRQQLESETMAPDEIEQALRNLLREVGQNGYGEMLSILDEH
jgi:hypothetical protein